MRCRFCNNELEKGETQCPRCGRSQNGGGSTKNTMFMNQPVSDSISFTRLFFGHLLLIVGTIALVLFYSDSFDEIPFYIYIVLLLAGGLGSYLIEKSGIKRSTITLEIVALTIIGIILIALNFLLGMWNYYLMIIGIALIVFAISISSWVLL